MTPAVARPHDQRPSVTAARRAGEIQIDGKLDEAAWQAAAPSSNFTQIDPHEGQPASEKTEVRVLIDDAAVYVGARAFDREPGKIQAQLARRDENVDGDALVIMFDSFHDHVSAFLFRLSPAGARRDATVDSNGREDNTWDAVWEGSSSIDSLGWTAEFRIPLSQLRYNPNVADQTWGFQVVRTITRNGEADFLSFTPKNETQGVHAYGHLTGLGHLSSPRRMEIVPYVLAKNENPTVAPNDPFRKQNHIVPGGGVDFKYGLTSNITLDATINPDFGQVEVDPAVVNLSAFETFFPERRPFFVEGANIFNFGSMRTNNSSNGYNFVHTRRIGRSPQRSIDDPGITFVDAPNETTIDGAVKLTGKSAGGYSFGLLDALTAREEARFRDATGDHTAIVEPRANYLVGRLKRDLREGNTTIGVAATAVNRQLDDAALDPIFRKSAYVLGLDWNHSWYNRRWAFDGDIAFTRNAGSVAAITDLQLGPQRNLQRPDRRQFRFDPNRTALTGYLAELTLAKIAGLHWQGSVTYQEYSPTFEINELGFLGSTDMRGIAPLINYNENKPGKYLRNWSQYLFWNPTWNFDGDMTFNGVGEITFAELPNFWDLFLRFDWRPRVFDDFLTRGGPVAASPLGYSTEFRVDSDRRKRYTGGFTFVRSWNEAGGWATSVRPRIAMRPTTALRITVQPNYTRSRSMGQFVTTNTDATATSTYGTRYVFASLDQHQLAIETRVDWTFTPALSLQVFAQPLLASGDFYDYKQLARARSFDFQVFGRDAGTISRDASGTYTVDPDGAGAAPLFTFGERDFNQQSLRGNAVVRWEYRPGSALFFVWQQQRFQSADVGEFRFRQNFDDLLTTRPENVFVVKATWWIGR
ncbi:MAG TPA: DUF5916 domain-containing protein [Gemmatimonadaceae bacterium]|nr:DUF5916 domain-containing protein [Gemmatimonadaceae bacterium]